uniref:uncharacterized protein LOC114676308 n=1 Tax=Macaca mulatta TaxID=9544 RepID=UPI0010A2554B|nr:uncharacterized protein LOC114676308 [Macaca mulatta]
MQAEGGQRGAEDCAEASLQLLHPHPASPPSPGSQCSGFADGPGWTARRRLPVQEDILIRSRVPKPSAAAGGLTRPLRAPLPRALAGRETEMVAAETGAPAPGRPRGAEAFESAAAPCQEILPVEDCLAAYRRAYPRSTPLCN